MCISPEVNVIARLKIELAYFEDAVQPLPNRDWSMSIWLDFLFYFSVLNAKLSKTCSHCNDCFLFIYSFQQKFKDFPVIYIFNIFFMLSKGRLFSWVLNYLTVVFFWFLCLTNHAVKILHQRKWSKSHDAIFTIEEH